MLQKYFSLDKLKLAVSKILGLRRRFFQLDDSDQRAPPTVSQGEKGPLTQPATKAD